MNKKLIYILGGVAVLGIGYYLYTRNKKKSANADAEGTPTESGETKSATAPTDAPTSADTPAKAGQNIKELKGKEKGVIVKMLEKFATINMEKEKIIGIVYNE
jgi:zona occludens toxin (predicted ATPase)